MQTNIKIKNCMYSCKIKAYEMPHILGISESTYYRKMRFEMSRDEQNEIIQKIKQYAKERNIDNDRNTLSE